MITNQTPETKAPEPRPKQRKIIRKALAGAVDYITYNKGIFTAKAFYYYRQGRTADALAAGIMNILAPIAKEQDLYIKLLNWNDEYHQWPTNSWLQARFEVSQKQTTVL
jgi:hypothetical protein